MARVWRLGNLTEAALEVFVDAMKLGGTKERSVSSWVASYEVTPKGADVRNSLSKQESKDSSAFLGM